MEIYGYLLKMNGFDKTMEWIQTNLDAIKAKLSRI